MIQTMRYHHPLHAAQFIQDLLMARIPFACTWEQGQYLVSYPVQAETRAITDLWFQSLPHEFRDDPQ